MKKTPRTYGTGTLRRIRSGKWRFEYKPSWATKRLSKVVEAESEKAAQTLLSDWVKELDARDKPQVEVSIDDLINLHAADMRVNGVDPKRIEDAKLSEVLHLGAYFAGFDFAKPLKKAHVKQFIENRLAAGYAPGTVNKQLAALHRGLVLAVEDELIYWAIPPCKKLRANNVREGFVDDAAYYGIQQHLPEHAHMLWCFGYRLGVRKGELLKIRTEWVHYHNEPDPYIRIPGFTDRKQAMVEAQRAAAERAGKVVSIENKRGRARVTKSGGGHTIPLYHSELRAFVEHALATNDPACPYLFQYRGQQLQEAFRKSFERACVEAGYPDMIFHDTRRSAVRMMEDASIPRRKAMQITGHKTESIYLRYNISTEAEALEAGKELAAFAEQREQKRKSAHKSAHENATATVKYP